MYKSKSMLLYNSAGSGRELHFDNSYRPWGCDVTQRATPSSPSAPILNRPPIHMKLKELRCVKPIPCTGELLLILAHFACTQHEDRSDAFLSANWGREGHVL